MPNIIFTHPDLDETLVVATGANNISWSYNLQTQSYPTYGGEVVQVLSTNIDNLQITGEVKSYGEMEQIYAWFIRYMARATQGAGGTSYSEEPVTMSYPTRGWSLQIQPISLPGLRYGRDVIIPTWSLQANIIDPDPDMGSLSIDQALNQPQGSALEYFGRMTADVGYRYANPYSDPLGILTAQEHENFPDAKQPYAGMAANEKGQVKVDEWLDGLSKQMQGAYKAMLNNGEPLDLLRTLKLDDISGPTTGKTSTDADSSQTKDSKKNG